MAAWAANNSQSKVEQCDSVSVSLQEKNQVVANGRLIFVAWPLRYGYRRRQWLKKVQHLGQDVGGALPPPGDVLHFGMPPVRKQSTPTFRPHPSGDQLKVSKFERTQAENGGRSLICQENVAIVLYPEGAGNFLFRWRDRPWGSLLSPKSCGQETQEKVLQTHIYPNWLRDHWRLKFWKMPPGGGGVFACPENLHGSHPYMQTHLPNHLWYSPSFSEMFVRRWTAQKG